MINSVLSIDPGRVKCGIALVSRDDGVIARTIVSVGDLPDTAHLLASRFEPDAVIIGGGTGADAVANEVVGMGLAIRIVDERLSTQYARARYFKDNPPRGWRKLVPIGLQVPPEPYDDYAAIVLAEAFLRGEES